MVWRTRAFGVWEEDAFCGIVNALYSNEPVTLRRFLILVSIGTAISWLGWITVLYSVDPVSSGSVGRFLFYLSLFFALIGTFALIGFFFRTWFSRERIVERFISIAIRQAILLAILLVGTLMLQGNQLFSWWSGVLLLFAIAAVELFFLSQAQPHER